MKTVEKAYQVFAHYRAAVNPDVSHYYGIIACRGLTSLAELDGSFLPELREVLARFEVIEHPNYNFPSYRIGGIAKARAVFDRLLTGEKYDAELREYSSELMTARRSQDGIVSMPYPGGEGKIWIDVATAVTPFLLCAGLRLGEQRYIDEAVFQTLKMYEVFLDRDCGLLHQSRGFCGKDRISADHWSRGNGWGIFPLSELCALLPDSNPEKARCVETYRRHLDALMKYRSENCLWRQEITLGGIESDGRLLESYEETSGSGLILAAIGTGISAGILDSGWIRVLREGIEGLLRVSVGENGETRNSCPGCLCPGDGSIRAYLSHKPSYTDEPHGAGPVILALASAARCGIDEI